MMCSLVTGAAGFIGSHLVDRLLADGHQVIGVDSLTSYYDPAIKRANLAHLAADRRFRLVQADLTTADLGPLLKNVDYVFHQAAQAGVRASWGSTFTDYVTHNLLATQALLEAVKACPPRKVVFASSSSVYGNAPLPMRETARARPVSPYGVTKLAAEHLCHVYQVNYGVPIVALRYFTVYGPRQRPDMGMHRFIQAVATGAPITVYGDGLQSRDYTYVGDIVEANRLAALSSQVGATFNIGGGSQVTLRDVFRTIECTLGKKACLILADQQRGDVDHTAADTGQARRLLGYRPSVDLAEGVRRQVAWQVGAAVPLRSTGPAT